MNGLKWILEALPVGVWVGQIPDGRVIYANPAFKVILGMDAVESADIGEAPVTYGIFDRSGLLYPPENLPFSRVVATREPVTIDDLVIHRPDGRKVNIRAFAFPTFDSNNDPNSVVIAFIDITKEVTAEIEREETEARLALAVNHAPIAIWSTNRDGVITLSEGAGLRALGVDSGQLVGLNIFELYKDHPTIPGYLRRGLAGESFPYTVQVGSATYDTWLMPIRNAGGEVIGVTGVSHDVSEIRNLQANAIQNDRVIALGTLAASVAHEINNPLTYMKGHADLLQAAIRQLGTLVAKTHKPSIEELRELAKNMGQMIEPMRSGAERIADITRELRTFSRSEGDDVVPVHVPAVVRSVVQLVGKELEARARLLLDLQETSAIMGSQVRLVQVVLNLVVNALHALPNGRNESNEISIRTFNDGDRVVIEVADSGPGVAPANRERIFDPFVSTKEIGDGSGLGLFVCRNIVRALAGEVTVDDRPGGGALFRVSLPASGGSGTADENASLRRRRRLKSPSRGRILIIDDEVMVAEIFRAQLAHSGYRAEHEQDGGRALERLVHGDGPAFDLIFCDVMMKGVSGMDIAEALELRSPDILARVVFMTGGAFTSRARDFLERHAECSVEKPFDIVAEAQRHIRRLRSDANVER